MFLIQIILMDLFAKESIETIPLHLLSGNYFIIKKILKCLNYFAVTSLCGGLALKLSIAVEIEIVIV